MPLHRPSQSREMAYDSNYSRDTGFRGLSKLWFVVCGSLLAGMNLSMNMRTRSGLVSTTLGGTLVCRARLCPLRRLLLITGLRDDLIDWAATTRQHDLLKIVWRLSVVMAAFCRTQHPSCSELPRTPLGAVFTIVPDPRLYSQLLPSTSTCSPAGLQPSS